MPRSLTKISTALVIFGLRLEHARAAVLQHPARRRGAAHDLQQNAEIHAHLVGQGEGLGHHGDVDAAEELVDGLDGGALSRLLADVMDLVAHRGEDGLHRFEGGARRRRHDGERGAHRSDDTARHRRIDEAPAGGLDPLREGRYGAGRAGRHQHHGGIAGQRFQGAVREQQGFGLGRVHHHQHQRIGIGCRGGRGLDASGFPAPPKTSELLRRRSKPLTSKPLASRLPPWACPWNPAR